MRRMTLIFLLLLLVTGGFAAYVRLSANPAGRWHQDPLAVTARGAQNSYLLAPGGDGAPAHLPLPPDEVARRLDAVTAATPRTELLAEGGFGKTWVTRSRLWGFPDFTSVRLIAGAEGGTDLLIFARSRFGKSDLGVNRARVEDWLARLAR